jgi:hypothetical protein
MKFSTKLSPYAVPYLFAKPWAPCPLRPGFEEKPIRLDGCDHAAK